MPLVGEPEERAALRGLVELGANGVVQAVEAAAHVAGLHRREVLQAA